MRNANAEMPLAALHREWGGGAPGCQRRPRAHRARGRCSRAWRARRARRARRQPHRHRPLGWIAQRSAPRPGQTHPHGADRNRPLQVTQTAITEPREPVHRGGLCSGKETNPKTQTWFPSTQFLHQPEPKHGTDACSGGSSSSMGRTVRLATKRAGAEGPSAAGRHARRMHATVAPVRIPRRALTMCGPM